MRWDIVQVLAMSSHAGPFLRGKSSVAPELFPGHISFKTVQSVDFVRPSTGQISGMMAESVAPWLRRLASEDVTALPAILRSLPMSDVIGEDAVWGLVTDGDRGLEIWKPHWRRRSGLHEDKPRFVVTYDSSRVQRLAVPPRVGINDAIQLMSNAAAELLQRCAGRGLAAQIVPLDAWVRRTEPTDSKGPADGLLREDTPPDVLEAANRALTLGEIVVSPQWAQSPVMKDPAGAKLTLAAWQSSLIALEAVCDAN